MTIEFMRDMPDGERRLDPDTAPSTITISPKIAPRPFRSFVMGGFEGSSHRRADGRQLDLIGATRHDTFALQDY